MWLYVAMSLFWRKFFFFYSDPVFLHNAILERGMRFQTIYLTIYSLVLKNCLYCLDYQMKINSLFVEAQCPSSFSESNECGGMWGNFSTLIEGTLRGKVYIK